MYPCNEVERKSFIMIYPISKFYILSRYHRAYYICIYVRFQYPSTQNVRSVVSTIIRKKIQTICVKSVGESISYCDYERNE